MTYAETIEYLFTRLPMFSRIGAAALKPDLTNTIRLCEKLGNPQKEIKTIHVAGTNGKGSVSHMLASIFQKAGYKTGLYTSPHLYDFRERIKINGEFISEDAVVSFTNEIKPYIEEIDPSYFEITVVMAFNYFRKEKTEIAIIETGLGGRLDSTNIINPEISIITNIGFDHIQLLGNTLDKIAYEKAGIIKENTPVIIGERNSETEPVFIGIAQEKKAPILFSEDLFEIVSHQLANNILQIIVEEKSTELERSFNLDLLGLYQKNNLLTVLTACKELKKKGWILTDDSIKTGLESVKSTTGFQGRWEIVKENPSIVLDVAHNEDGIKSVLRQLNEISFTNLHIVTGMVKDKDIDAAVKLLPKDASYYFTNASIPRALPCKELQEIAAKEGLIGNCYLNVDAAISAAKLNANENDLILVCGSVFIVGEVNRKAL
jgi:dihydrofolate synthase/folylpolyglutamate synthase